MHQEIGCNSNNCKFLTSDRNDHNVLDSFLRRITENQPKLVEHAFFGPNIAASQLICKFPRLLTQVVVRTRKPTERLNTSQVT